MEGSKNCLTTSAWPVGGSAAGEDREQGGRVGREISCGSFFELCNAPARKGMHGLNLHVANSGGCKLGFLLLTHERVEREVQELLREVSTSIREQHRALAAAGDRRDHHGLPADEHGGGDQGREKRSGWGEAARWRGGEVARWRGGDSTFYQ